ncbi:hypothetical protein FOZ63_012991 [Perkinsus olseni]|uniref:Uncharacterized protein n=1 Tax=Perkinsus olseni TaxID=32597 RepID=A0A7J6QBW3_PEROL|nr:hypothetical protein FOZ63_012991 [Perkinsus olseni]KAF4751276.1 hypothetical protein FOZ62_006040 [Perkinsus olseni]
MRTEGGMLKDLAVVKTVDHVMKLETTSGNNDGDAPVRAEAFVVGFSCKEIPHTAIMVTHDDEPVILFHIDTSRPHDIRDAIDKPLVTSAKAEEKS